MGQLSTGLSFAPQHFPSLRGKCFQTIVVIVKSENGHPEQVYLSFQLLIPRVQPQLKEEIRV